MKVKRFNNLWAMGLILFGAILIAFYIAKIFFPEFIVGVAEIPQIVKIGNYIDNHKWAYYIFDSILSFVGAYLYCGASCRTSRLSLKSILVIITSIILLKFVSTFLPYQYTATNYAIFGFLPFLICLVEKCINKNTFISTSVCVFVDIMAQSISMAIRDIVLMTTHLNSITFLILLIDTWILRTLLFLFFNYKEKEIKNG